MKNRIIHQGIIGIFISLYFLVATISMINSVAFFDLAHNGAMNWSLAIGFELGAAASLAAIIILDKTNRLMVWTLFLLLTAFQMMANSYHAFVNLETYMGWIELFGLEEMEPLAQKRILAIVSGAVLPIVALGFIKSLVDYIRPESKVINPEVNTLDNLLDTKPTVNVAPTQLERSKLNAIRESHISNIKDKTQIHEPEPVDPNSMVSNIETVRQEILAQEEKDIKNGLYGETDEGPYTFESDIEVEELENIIEEDNKLVHKTEAAIVESPHPGYPAPANPDLGNVVDVRVEDNTTYVTTRKKTEEDI